MLARKQEINLQLNQILDSLLIALAFWLSHTLRVSDLISFEELPLLADVRTNIPPFSEFFWLMAIAVPFTPLVLEFQGYYENPLHKTFGKSLKQLFRTLIIIGVVIGGCVIFFKWTAKSRSVLLILVFVGGALLVLKERLIIMYLRRQVSKGELKEKIIVAGMPADVKILIKNMLGEQKAEIDIVAQVDVANRPIQELVDALHEHSVSRVLFAADHMHFANIEEAIQACETEGVEAWLSMDFIRTSITEPKFDVMGGKPMLVFRSTPEASWALLCKGVMDRVGALILLILTSWLWIVAAIGIKLSSRGPIFFKQMRSGKYGEPFSMLKFRTMYVDAEERKEALQAANEMEGPVFKMENDPRIFRFGKFLRRYSVDEIPQFVNILLGHMSLVGPRPLPVDEVNRIEESSQRRRLSVKPGLTCLWQIGGRNHIVSFEDWVELDLKYIDNWSIWLDLKILVKTVPAVLLGSGAK